MFKKLLSNLPFNPSLINQISFYAKRIHRESAVRRTGFFVLILAMVIQLFAVVSPPQPTLASDINNDLIPGGFTSIDEAFRHCQKNDYNFNDILSHFAISCDNLAKATINNSLRSDSQSNQLFSMGRIAQGTVNQSTHKATDEVPIIIGDDTYYMRRLSSWDHGVFSTYKALSVGNSFGVQYYILFSCGNIVQKGQPAPPPPKTPPPPPVLPKVITCSNLVLSVADGAKVNVGSQITTRGQAAGQNLPTNQRVNMYYELVNASTNKVAQTAASLHISFKSNVADDPNGQAFTMKETGHFVIRLSVKTDPGGQTAKGSQTGNCLKSITVEKLCEAAQTGQDIKPCLEMHKKASNITQKINNANGTKAKAGDTIEYTLIVKNTARITFKAFVVKEDIGDILEYAKVTKLGGATQTGTNLKWPSVDIPAGQTIQKQFTVKVKDPIPQTPSPCVVKAVKPCPSSSSFDLKMTNVYGDTITISLPGAIIKQSEIITQELPNTGPGTSLIIGFVVTSIAGYFFARSRLMAKELDIVRKDFSTGGGY